MLNFDQQLCRCLHLSVVLNLLGFENSLMHVDLGQLVLLPIMVNHRNVDQALDLMLVIYVFFESLCRNF